jgi:ATP-dependent Clp protease, protease subunit
MAQECDSKKDKDSLEEKLLKLRTCIISGEITQKLAEKIMRQLLLMAADSDAPIRLFINSQGGHVESGDTLYDLIKFVKPEVKIVGTGWVASAGLTIYLAAKKENRFALPNTRFLIHQPTGSSFGAAADIHIEAEEIKKMRRRLNELISRETGQTLEKVETDTDRNFWMSAEQAKTYGVVGRIVNRAEEVG